MIKYGIDSFVLTAPWSLVVSILMFSGTAIFGFFILNYIKSIKIINKISNFYYQLPILGFLALLLIMYPLILFNIISPYFVKLVALFLISLNFFFIRFYKIILDFVCELRSQQYKIDKIIVILLVFGYFLISLGPITSADSVDYHSSVAINIVNFASYQHNIIGFIAE